ncbi:hypothetical protein QN345_05900 [Cryobacterium sp. 10I1]|uniref:hypothetical protein n=1 Tax=unclassified Cryobacterium TaxID=2649013 RepID=UPI002AC98290|nr:MULTISPECIES: hypothetical protein [unclassified Cryobacterium]MEB0287005.1 hypothetical protein [Cryobacterium sp. 10S3]MEB0304851.1 hypothetical protein [Cryobacterium sp. 10I1]WPX15746.1 hypothetical protein RHM57_14615 [Cryobacterium sp. 10S3]
MWLKIRLQKRIHREEGGVALVAVIGLALVMLLLAATALSFTASGTVKARDDQDSTAALAAAYAGVDEYGSRLSNDSTYEKFGNPAAPFTIGTGSTTTVSMPVPGNENPAFGVGSAGTWGTVAGAGGRASFRYEVDNSLYSSSGIVRIRSTGKVGASTRSIVANLKQKGFIDFLYFTNYEFMDPQITGSTRCVDPADVRHAPHDPDCTEIQFASGDILDGPVHSNDQMRICGAKFLQGVTTSSTLTPNYVNTCPGTPIVFGTGTPAPTGPVWAPTLDMPPTNASMPNETRVDLPADVPRPGCMYTGPTTITFDATGHMRVISPWTKFTRPSYTVGILSQNPIECGDLASLNSPAGALVTVPDQNLIFVQTASSTSTDPNYWAPGVTPANFSCTGSGGDQGWTYGSPVALRYPVATEDRAPTSTSALPAYQCRTGDAFVKGVVKGAVTVATDNFIYVTGNLTYVDPAFDVLGLVAQNAVWVWNPMDCPASGGRSACTEVTTANGGAPLGDREIDAAILSINHTFQVQNYDTGGSHGTLTVLGAIAQKFRGTVGTGTGTTGFLKNYKYDSRLHGAAPPKFLAPTSTTYGVTQYVDVATAFAADGTALP